MPSPTIFISYRSSEPGWAAYLDRSLTAEFGAERVFRASSRITAGQSFPDRIRAAAADAVAMLVVIGPDWLTVDRSGRRRIDDPDDWVRQEIKVALGAAATVIPLLVDDATMPDRTDLPADIRPLVERQFVRLTHKDDADVVRRLVDVLAPLLPGPGPEAVAPPAVDLDAAVLRIHGEEGAAAGAGILVGEGLGLAGAGVVAAVLGVRPGESPPASARVRVDVPLPREGPTVAARVEAWVPSPDGGVAVLSWSEHLPAAVPVPLVVGDDVWGHPARIVGFPEDHPDGRWLAGVLRAPRARGSVQLDLDGHADPGGADGSPVWDETIGGVVGMAQVADGASAEVRVLPTAALLDAWPPLRDLVRPRSPFRGLRPFGEDDAADFHGRGSESEDVARAATVEQWVTLVGASGCGKSSLAMAGVLPRLVAAGWLAVVVRPAAGSRPAAALAAALLPLIEPESPVSERLARLADLTTALTAVGGMADVAAELLKQHGAPRLLVVVDQLEELFSQPEDAVDAFAGLLFDPALPASVRVLSTLRTDHLDVALAHARLASTLTRRVQVLSAMRSAQLHEVVTAPVAAAATVRYEPHLVERIVDDVGTAPGALPLLSFTLDQLWRQQQNGRLSHAVYTRLGGVAGALAAHAEQAWNDVVPAAEQPAAKRLLLTLCRTTSDGTATSRRLVRRGELDETQWRLARGLASSRLLVTGRTAEGDEVVELAHEAVIASWTRLRAWVTQDLAFLTWRQSLRDDLDRWLGADRPPHLLPTTAALAVAGEWSPEQRAGLTSVERDYLAQGRTHHRARRRRRRAVVAAASLLLTLVVLLGGLYAFQRGESLEQAALADSRALAQASQDEAVRDPALSMMLSVAAHDRAPTQEAISELLRNRVTFARTHRVVSGFGAEVTDEVAGQDGDVVLARTAPGSMTLAVGVTAAVRTLVLPPRSAPSAAPMLKADGRRVAVYDVDGRVTWYDVDPTAVNPLGPPHILPPAPWGAEDASTAMSPDGRTVAALHDGAVAVWDLASGSQRTTAIPPIGETALGVNLRVDDGGRHLYVDGPFLQPGLTALDLATGTSEQVLPATGKFAVSRDRTAVVSCEDGLPGGAVVVRRRLPTGQAVGQPRTVPNGSCVPLAVDPTGRRVLLAGTPDHPVDGVQLIDLEGPGLGVGHLVNDREQVSPDLVGADDSWTVLSRDRTRVTVTSLEAVTDGPAGRTATLTADGSSVFGLSGDGSRLEHRRSADLALVRSVALPTPWTSPRFDDRVRLGPGGALLAIREPGATVSVWDAATLTRIAAVTVVVPTGGDDSVTTFFAGDSLVTVAGHLLQQWDPRSGRELARLDLDRTPGAPVPTTGLVLHVSRHPVAGQVVVHRDGDPDVRVLDIATGTVVASVRVPTDTAAVSFDPEGRFVVLYQGRGLIDIRELDPDRLVAELPVRVDLGYTVGWLPGHRYIVAGDDIVRVYGADRGAAVLETYNLRSAANSDPRSAGPGPFGFADVSGDGSAIYVTDPSGGDFVLRLQPAAWKQDLCERIAHRQFDDLERARIPALQAVSTICPSAGEDR